MNFVCEMLVKQKVLVNSEILSNVKFFLKAGFSAENERLCKTPQGCCNPIKLW